MNYILYMYIYFYLNFISRTFLLYYCCYMHYESFFFLLQLFKYQYMLLDHLLRFHPRFFFNDRFTLNIMIMNPYKQKYNTET